MGIVPNCKLRLMPHGFLIQGHISCHGEAKCTPTTSKNSDSLLNTHSTIEEWRNLGKMKMNELGRQKFCHEQLQQTKKHVPKDTETWLPTTPYIGTTITQKEQKTKSTRTT